MCVCSSVMQWEPLHCLLLARFIRLLRKKKTTSLKISSWAHLKRTFPALALKTEDTRGVGGKEKWERFWRCFLANYVLFCFFFYNYKSQFSLFILFMKLHLFYSRVFSYWVFGLRVCFHHLVFQFPISFSWLLFTFTNTFPPSFYYSPFSIWKSQSIFFCNFYYSVLPVKSGISPGQRVMNYGFNIFLWLTAKSHLPTFFKGVCVCVYLCACRCRDDCVFMCACALAV